VQGALQLSVIVFAVQLNALLTEPPIEKAVVHGVSGQQCHRPASWLHQAGEIY
jgi:hypothetical protein